MVNMRQRLIVLGAINLVFMVACATPPYKPHLVSFDQLPLKKSTIKKEIPEYVSKQAALEDYEIEVGDELEIKFFHFPEFNQKIVVRPDGKISLPLAEEIQARGITPKELDRVLTQEYKKKLTKPDLTVMVMKFANRYIYVGGEIHQPGEHIFDYNETLIHVIFKKGGFKDSARSSQILVIRKGEEDLPNLIELDINKLLKKKGRDRYFYLRPYDVVYVPKSTIANINLFVDQYINKIIPSNLSTGFSFIYSLNNPPQRIETLGQ